MSDMSQMTVNVCLVPRATNRCSEAEIFSDNVSTSQFVRPTQNVSSASFSARLAETWECPSHYNQTTVQHVWQTQAYLFLLI